MKAVNRQALIYEYIKKHQEVSINHIAEYFRISPVTARRYVSKLEQNGLICHRYGKAIITDQSKGKESYHSRSKKNIECKRRIAQLALPHLMQVSSAFLDASSTTMELLKLLPKSKAITIYAANLTVFHYLEDYENVRFFLLGGYLNRPDGLILDSELTMSIAKDIFVDAVFFSCAGFTGEGVFSNGTAGVGVNRILMKNAAHNYLLADHTKFNEKGIYKSNTWDTIQTLVCDTSFDKEAEDMIRSKGVNIIY